MVATTLPPDRRECARGGSHRRSIRLRAAVAVPLFCVLGWAATAGNLSNAAMRTDPLLALRLAGVNGEAMDHFIALELRSALQDGRPAGTASKARAALEREPFALASLAALSQDLRAEGRAAQADALLDHAARLSRRDMLVQLALIDREARRGDLTEMLRQMDLMLRVHQESYPAIFPALTAQISHPDLVRPLIALAREDPDWLALFLGHAITVEEAVPAVARLLIAAPDGRAARDQQMRRNVFSQLIAGGNYSVADDYFRSLHGAPSGWIRDPAFAEPHLEPPFGWTLSGNAAAVQGEGIAISLGLSGDDGAAWQLVSLAPGIYRIILHGDRQALETIRPKVTCPASKQPVPVESLGGAATYGVSIRPSCPWQELALEIRGTTIAGTGEAILNRITVSQIRPAPADPARNRRNRPGQ